MLPAPTDEGVNEYFTMLGDGVVTLWERLRDDLPGWAVEYRFPNETNLIEEYRQRSKDISDLENRLRDFDRLKRVLVLQSEPLVDAIIDLFDKIFQLKLRREEAFREDLTLLDPQGNVVALIEVKGVNGGVGREHVNQADSHRARADLPLEFPSLLIVNTHMKASKSLADKDKAVATEQIVHAARNNVLILRSLDLLNLASLLLSGKLDLEGVIELLTKSSGWLRVSETAAVLKG
jgi:hypothetical protein